MMLYVVNLTLLTIVLVALQAVNLLNLIYLIVVIVCIPLKYGTDNIGMVVMIYTQVSLLLLLIG